MNGKNFKTSFQQKICGKILGFTKNLATKTYKEYADSLKTYREIPKGMSFSDEIYHSVIINMSSVILRLSDISPRCLSY
jgi:hypothetical protein